MHFHPQVHSQGTMLSTQKMQMDLFSKHCAASCVDMLMCICVVDVAIKRQVLLFDCLQISLIYCQIIYIPNEAITAKCY